MITFTRYKELMDGIEESVSKREANIVELAGDYAFDGADVIDRLKDEFAILETLQYSSSALMRMDLDYDN